MKRNAFTLIEILVVVAIIGLLIGILMPVLSAARITAKRTTCASQLHQVSLAMMAYLHDSKDHMPYASEMPSISPAPLDLSKPAIFFGDVLAKHLKGNGGALECPEDRPGIKDRDPPNAGKSYFQSERSSYEYNVRLRGLTPPEFNKRLHGPPGHEHQHENDRHPPNTIWFARDYWNFHNKDLKSAPGARRYAHIDGHVSDMEN